MRIVMISTILPHGHYTENLLRGLDTINDLQLTIYTPQPEKSDLLPPRIIQKNIWRKNIFFILDILKQLPKDKPDIVHLQHEFTMYGGVVTALLFPILVILLRLQGYRVVTTLHAVVGKNQITKEFVNSFMINPPVYITPLTFSLVFTYIYTIIAKFSHTLICHTHILKDYLIEDYGAAQKKVLAIPPVVPEKHILKLPTESYFFYYGYMVRRKGIENVLLGLAQVIKKYPQYKLVMAGGIIPGQEKAFEELKEKIEEIKIEKNVIIKGFIEKESTLAELYAKAYAVVIPARLSIAASGPLYHARGYHKCVLASNIGNFTEEIQNGQNGILVDNDHWAEAMTETIEHPELVKKVAQASAARAEEYSQKNIAQKYFKMYKKIQIINKYL
ncbi:hypothetical protein BH09PAT2_BH09PAT2_01560 [soil metagenome]